MLTENQQGIIFMFFSVICFSTMDILVKFLSASYPIFQLVLFRGVFGLIPIFLLFLKIAIKIYFILLKLNYILLELLQEHLQWYSYFWD